ncbi:MAG: hypothetical protein OXF08_06120, partial [Bacteroidetes bacterium]|nr:hypothetical protein [Bacteroidota bacterium]
MVNVKNLMMLVHLITESQYTGLHSLKSILKILDIFFDDVFHDPLIFTTIEFKINFTKTES